MPTPHIAVIGGGTMARAIIEGCLDARARSAPGWLVVEPDETKRAHFQSLGIATFAAASDLAASLDPDDQLLLAVKPQALPVVADQLHALNLNRVVISILAGIPSAVIHEALGRQPRVIRAMPNLPARVRQGATAITLGSGAQPGDEHTAVEVFSAIGPVVEILGEDLLDAFTAVAGSGPAYLFYLAESMTRAAADLGFEPDQAERIVRQTVIGAAAVLADCPDPPADLRAAVTSKGGTTAAATAVLDDADVMGAVRAAIHAARDRGRELGQTTT